MDKIKRFKTWYLVTSQCSGFGSGFSIFWYFSGFFCGLGSFSGLGFLPFLHIQCIHSLYLGIYYTLDALLSAEQ